MVADILVTAGTLQKFCGRSQVFGGHWGQWHGPLSRCWREVKYKIQNRYTDSKLSQGTKCLVMDFPKGFPTAAGNAYNTNQVTMSNNVK